MNRFPASPSIDDTSASDVLMEALEALSDGIAVFDPDRRLALCNERFAEMLEPIREILQPGLRWEDLLQACVAGGLYADPADRDREWRANVGPGDADEVEIAQSNGRVHGLRYNPTASGGFVIVRKDVTSSRKTSQSLQESEALLRNILDTNPTPVVMSRLRDGLILYRSPAARDLFGETTYAIELYETPADRERYVRTLRRDGRVNDTRMVFRTADGARVPMSSSGRLTRYAGETCVVTTLIDLREFAAREAIARKVVEHCPAPILMTEAESGRVLFRSPEIDRIFGTVANTRDFYVDPADRNGFLEALQRDGTVIDYKARFHRGDGQPFWGAISARMFEYEGRDVIVSYTRDMTVQLELETDLSRRRERMFQNEKLSALGGVLANVSHALNNPLSVVVGHALMLREESADPDVVRQATRIGEAAERCADIVKTYLTLTRQEPVDLQPSDLNEIAMTALDVVRPGLAETGRTVATRFAKDLPEVMVDPDQMAQVVINLLQNAQAAIVDSGVGSRITVTTEPGPQDGWVRLVVEDDGPGVSQEIAKKVFDPFFTTRGVGNGQGIGLTWCHRVVQTHNGRISLDPAHRPGARFLVDLPAMESPGAPANSRKQPPGTARILVVDDERDVADLSGEVLERAGYEVQVVYSGGDAIDALAGSAFDCVLSDLAMGTIDGRALFDHIRRDHPEIVPRTGFVTGDTMGRTSQSFLVESGRPYLEKPVSPQELRDFVADLLADGAER